jgi:WAS/WASL-interacting protein
MKVRYPTPDVIMVNSVLEAIRQGAENEDDDPTELGSMAEVVRAIEQARAEQEKKASATERAADDTMRPVAAPVEPTKKAEAPKKSAAKASAPKKASTPKKASAPKSPSAPSKLRAVVRGATAGLVMASSALVALVAFARPQLPARATAGAMTAAIDEWIASEGATPAAPKAVSPNDGAKLVVAPVDVVSAPVVVTPPASTAPRASSPRVMVVVATPAQPAMAPPPPPPPARPSVAAVQLPAAPAPIPARVATAPAPAPALQAAPPARVASAPAPQAAPPPAPKPAVDEFEAAARLSKLAHQQLDKSIK